MVEAILPPGICLAETSTDAEPSETLFPEEAALVAGAVEKRRREFAAGRACARRALRALGLTTVPILSGGSREPVWPAGVVGAITHSAGLCAAAVGRQSEYAGIGIDLERHQAISEGVEEMVCTPAERAWARERAADGVHWPLVIFSAKESVYKAWYPIVRQWLGFEDAELDLDPERGLFGVCLEPSKRALLG